MNTEEQIAYDLEYWRCPEHDFKQRYISIVKYYELTGSYESVLDIGAGAKSGILRYVTASKKTSIDNFNDVFAKEGVLDRCPNTEYLSCTWNDFVPEKYDLVVAIDTFDHNDISVSTIGRVCDMLLPGGVFCFHINCRASAQLNDRHPAQIDLNALFNQMYPLEILMFNLDEHDPFQDNPYKTITAKWRKR